MASGEAGQNSPCTPKGRAKRKDGFSRCEGWEGLPGQPDKKAAIGATQTSPAMEGSLISGPGQNDVGRKDRYLMREIVEREPEDAFWMLSKKENVSYLG